MPPTDAIAINAICTKERVLQRFPSRMTYSRPHKHHDNFIVRITKTSTHRRPILTQSWTHSITRTRTLIVSLFIVDHRMYHSSNVQALVPHPVVAATIRVLQAEMVIWRHLFGKNVVCARCQCFSAPTKYVKPRICNAHHLRSTQVYYTSVHP